MNEIFEYLIHEKSTKHNKDFEVNDLVLLFKFYIFLNIFEKKNSNSISSLLLQHNF